MLQIFSLIFALCLAHCVATAPQTGILIKESYCAGKPVHISEDSKYVDLLFNSDIAIDKSMLIKEVMEEESKVLLITTPRCWGKTTNINMIKTFLQLQVNSKGEIIKSAFHRLFEDGEVTVNGTTKKLKFVPLIGEHQSFVDKHLGQYPVISISLYFGGIDTIGLVSGFLYWISKAFDEYDYVLNYFNSTLHQPMIDNVTNRDVRLIMHTFEQIRNRSEGLSFDELVNSVELLSAFIFLYFRRKVVIIIDEYLVPMEAPNMTPLFMNEDRKKFTEFYTYFMEATLLRNTYLHKAIITGIMRPMHELQQQVFPEITECNLLNGKFMEYYGVNQWELKEIYDTMQTPSLVRQQIDYWYKGYNVNHRDLLVYNVLSLNKVFTTTKGARYWTDTANIELFMQNFYRNDIFVEKLRDLLNDRDIVAESNHNYFLWSEYDALVKAAHQYFPAYNETVNKALMFLYELGYLTLSKPCDETAKYIKYHFKFPNNEVKSAMNDTWFKYVKKPLT